MRGSAASLTAVVVMSWSSFALAGPVVDAATRAEALQAEGKAIEALDALDAAMDKLCDASPLAFRKVVVVDSSEGFGVYSERINKIFKPDEKLLVYVEPVCLGEGANGALGFKADLAIENMTGQILGEAKDVFSISTSKRRDLSTTLSFGVPYLRPGEYKAAFTVRDQNSDKTGTFEVPFTIGLPTAN